MVRLRVISFVAMNWKATRTAISRAVVGVALLLHSAGARASDAGLPKDAAYEAPGSVAPAATTDASTASIDAGVSPPSNETEEASRAKGGTERDQAADAAGTTGSEAERIVSEEIARLLALENQVHAILDNFQKEREGIALRRDSVLGWQRRIRDAKAAGASEADTTYDALRRALRASRDELSVALDGMGPEVSAVPALGGDPLADLPDEAAAEVARERRTTVERAIVLARAEGEALKEERAAALLEEITTLNRERLGLLPFLSANKKDAITGFTAVGWDQARSEARHLSLILRYHQHVARGWLRRLQKGGGAAVSPWATARVLVPLFLAAVFFFWGRRRLHLFLKWSDARLGEIDRAERRTMPSFGRRTVRLLLRTHRSLGWILFFVFFLWLLPSGAKSLLEVQLISSVVSWSLAGSLIIDVINAFAAVSAGTFGALEEGETGTLRLRSLRLVGRTVVLFALILVLSSRLVGEGTIYSWVFSTCWFAAIPVFLLLVLWWRSTVFERLGRIRRKTRLQSWILANRSGWKSFGAAMAGALQLFISGALKIVRGWVARFDLARRIHAYLFKREIERIGEGNARSTLSPVASSVLEALHPERTCAEWVSCPADDVYRALVERANARRGGVVAVVASRGMGKSSLLSQISKHVPEHARLTLRSSLEPSAINEAASKEPPILMLDDAHRLIEPCIGGFEKFDEIISLARRRADHTMWVFAIDASLWPLLKRARDDRPLFDTEYVLKPWSEKELAALIADRCEAAQIDPSYEDLLERAPSVADELDRLDALRAKRAGYERMLWDHVGGNPGLALEAWRASLGQDEAGLIHVRPLQVPDASTLERLPDSSLFVLRAVLQLAPASVETIAQATRLEPEQVFLDLGFGKSHGFYEEHSGQIRIAWPWLRAVNRLLDRRHLLVNV